MALEKVIRVYKVFEVNNKISKILSSQDPLYKDNIHFPLFIAYVPIFNFKETQVNACVLV